jgi:hypothetical protein
VLVMDALGLLGIVQGLLSTLVTTIPILQAQRWCNSLLKVTLILRGAGPGPGSLRLVSLNKVKALPKETLLQDKQELARLSALSGWGRTCLLSPC